MTSAVWKERRGSVPTDVTRTDDIPRSVERVLDLLEIALADPGCTLTSAAASAELTPTTALRYLRALETRGYLDRDDQGRFHPGATIQRIAAVLHGSGPLERLVATAQPHLDALAAESGESVYLVVSDGSRASYVATAESPRAIRHVGWVGQNVPLEGTAAGAAFEKPGTAVVRTGAVEPDITAISMSMEGSPGLAIAISVVGPESRLVGDGRTRTIQALARSIDALRLDLGPTMHEEVAS